MYKAAGLYLNTISWISPKKGGEIGFKLFCRPIRPTMRKHHKEFLNSAEKSDFIYNGQKVQVYTWGTGPLKILFLHGWQSHSFRWKKYIENLPGDLVTIYALDAPGHGLSEGNYLNVPYYAELIQQFVIQYGNFDTIIAHSLGGMALLYALSHYDNLPAKKVVVMAVPGKAIDFIDYYHQALTLNQRTISIMNKHFEYRIGKPVVYFETENFVKHITIPGLIIHDTEDKDAPVAYAYKFHEYWENAELYITEGLGHNLKSKQVVEKIRRFILE